MKLATMTLVLAAGLIPSAIQAQAVGEREFMNACASCHGADAKGSGPVGDALTIVAPDLTGLSARNGGAFPLQHVVQIIDGRKGVRAHGSEAMPVWGAVFKAPIEGEISDAGAENAVRGRILGLAYYLESIQE
ncbi:c-type cytochrome [Oceanibium sediminis]|uniref:c-type cytochrome n=1 Tax=Oceanibium sediminis TaxID=2026339 RepID=UPI000DD454DD|nr:c-type cytochrome [Oceanibium sediminis]